MFPQKRFDAPKMYYINGNGALRYETPNAIDGKVVQWNAHVAPIVKLSGSENLYILDPSISEYPVTKPEYDYKFGGQITSYKICPSRTNFCRDDCMTEQVVDTVEDMKREKRTEKEERERLLIA